MTTRYGAAVSTAFPGLPVLQRAGCPTSPLAPPADTAPGRLLTAWEVGLPRRYYESGSHATKVIKVP